MAKQKPETQKPMAAETPGSPTETASKPTVEEKLREQIKQLEQAATTFAETHNAEEIVKSQINAAGRFYLRLSHDAIVDGCPKGIGFPLGVIQLTPGVSLSLISEKLIAEHVAVKPEE